MHLGAGAYGSVKQAIHIKTGFMTAIKIYEKFSLNNDRKKAVLQETTLLFKLNNTAITELYDVIEADRHIYLVMEYAQGKSLTSYMRDGLTQFKPLLDAEARHIMKQLFDGLSEMHSQHICHRDVKADNLIYDPATKKVKLIDFGFATQCKTKL